jgi:hypothetical protein
MHDSSAHLFLQPIQVFRQRQNAATLINPEFSAPTGMAGDVFSVLAGDSNFHDNCWLVG